MRRPCAFQATHASTKRNRSSSSSQVVQTEYELVSLSLIAQSHDCPVLTALGPSTPLERGSSMLEVVSRRRSRFAIRATQRPQQ
jgi:hypothetical protein